MIIFYMKCVILGKHLFSLFLVACIPPTYLYVLYQGQATVRLTVRSAFLGGIYFLEISALHFPLCGI